ncbi:hypothetical protein [Pseudomonas sp. TWP3-1]|uniref:hypothetical protein n=1 Tax=Pseudomonas sp. TWP3-1 TaxID=2804631 RepID=UPI003CEB47B0
MAEGHGKRHNDHAGEGEIEVHGGRPLSFGMGAILNRQGRDEKFGVLIPMIEAIDTRRLIGCVRSSSKCMCERLQG